VSSYYSVLVYGNIDSVRETLLEMFPDLTFVQLPALVIPSQIIAIFTLDDQRFFAQCTVSDERIKTEVHIQGIPHE
jgi:hypothetical protein